MAFSPVKNDMTGNIKVRSTRYHTRYDYDIELMMLPSENP